MKEKSIKKNFVLNFIKTLMLILFPLITFPYASRVLLPEGIGKVNFATSIISYFALIASLGITTYSIREGAKIRDDRIALSAFTKELYNINIWTTLIAYVCFVLALFLVPKFESYRLLLCVVSSSILFATLGREWLFSAVEEYEFITKRSVFFQFFSLVLLFLLVRTKQDYMKYAAISVVALAGSNLVNYFHSWKFVDRKVTKKIEYRKHIKPIMILFGFAAAVNIYTVLDTTLLGFFTSDTAVGIYTTGAKLIRMATSLITSLGVVLLPRLSFYSAKKMNREFDSLLKKAFDLILLAAVPSAFGLFLLSRPIILLLSGPNFLDSILVMRIMALNVIFVAISSFIGVQLFIPLRLEKITLLSTSLGATINLIINILLIPRLGVNGAAIANVSTEFLIVVLLVFLSKKYIDFRKCFTNMYQYLVAALAMSVYIYFVVLGLNSNLAKLLVGLFSGSVIYFATLVLIRNRIVYGIFQNKILKKNSRRV